MCMNSNSNAKVSRLVTWSWASNHEIKSHWSIFIKHHQHQRRLFLNKPTEESANFGWLFLDFRFLFFLLFARKKSQIEDDSSSCRLSLLSPLTRHIQSLSFSFVRCKLNVRNSNSFHFSWTSLFKFEVSRRKDVEIALNSARIWRELRRRLHRVWTFGEIGSNVCNVFAVLIESSVNPKRNQTANFLLQKIPKSQTKSDSCKPRPAPFKLTLVRVRLNHNMCLWINTGSVDFLFTASSFMFLFRVSVSLRTKLLYVRSWRWLQIRNVLMRLLA